MVQLFIPPAAIFLNEIRRLYSTNMLAPRVAILYYFGNAHDWRRGDLSTFGEGGNQVKKEVQITTR